MFPPLTLPIAGPSKTCARRCYLSDVFHADRVLLLVHMGFEVTQEYLWFCTYGSIQAHRHHEICLWLICAGQSQDGMGRRGFISWETGTDASWCQATCWGIGRWRWKETCYYRYLARLGWNHFDWQLDKIFNALSGSTWPREWRSCEKHLSCNWATVHVEDPLPLPFWTCETG